MLGQRLLELRKQKNLSQEEVADKLNVTRQTVSKWETDQSTPDFDKIEPICKLYGISPSELITGEKEQVETSKTEIPEEMRKEKYAKGIGIGVLLYIIAIALIMILIPFLKLNPILAVSIFLIICGVATYYIIYTQIVYKKKETKEEKEDSKLIKQIDNILSILFLIIYLTISFITMAWYITWILWIVYALVMEIIKLLFMLRRNQNEK